MDGEPAENSVLKDCWILARADCLFKQAGKLPLAVGHLAGSLLLDLLEVEEGLLAQGYFKVLNVKRVVPVPVHVQRGGAFCRRGDDG